MSRDRRPHLDFLTLLATAIAGRGVAVSANHSGRAYTDGASIFLPEQGDDADVVSVVVQAALLRCGSLDHGLALRLLGREAVTARFLRLEAARIAAVAGDIMPRLIQQSMAAAWHGVVPADASASLEWAMIDRAIPPAPEIFGSIRPLAFLRGQAATGTQDAPRKAQQRRVERRVLANERNRDEAGDGRSGLPKADSRSTVETQASKFSRAGESGSPGPGGGNGGAATAATWVRRISSSARAIGSALRFSSTELPHDGGLLYPEWSYSSGAYLSNWCRVKLYELPPGDRLHRGLPDPLLRRRLARLSMERVLHRRQAEGENLDNDALIRHVVDVASGVSPDGRIYESMRKTGPGLTAMVLIDASASTNDSQAAGATVWEAHRELARNLIAGMDELGDSVAAYGFRSFSRNDVRFLRIKEFDERFGQRARGRLMALNPFGFTRLGAAIRHASRLLITHSRMGHRLLVIVSDGLPYDMDYEGSHAEYDVRRALEEALQQGIGCVCLSTGSSAGKEALQRTWGPASHATLQTPSELNRCVEPLFRAALVRAAADSAFPMRRRAASAGRQADSRR
ncbi:MAG: von Willebrand factor [Nevskia sp.]|nr:von Willebrand factor [Nevskia sp.]